MLARTLICLLVALSGFFASAALGQTYTWDGGSGVNSNWSRDFNWVGDSAPPSGGGLGIGLIFDGATRLNSVQDFGVPFILQTLTFASGAGAFNLSGSTLQFEANHLGAQFRQDSSSSITIANEIRIDSLSISGSGSGMVTLNGPITGTEGLSKGGSFTLILGAANSFTGLVRINQGTVRAAANDVVNGNNVTIEFDSTFDLNGHSATIGSLTLANGQRPNQTVGPQVRTISGTLTLGGTVTYTPAPSGQSPAATISGNLNLGTTGLRTFNIGLPTINNPEFITEADISGGTGGISKTGGGTWLALSGTWTFSGNTVINEGSLFLRAANILSPSSTVILNGGLLKLRRLSGGLSNNQLDFVFFDQTIGGLSGASGNSIIIGSASLTVGANNASASFDGVISAENAMGGKLIKVGTGTQTLTGSNTFSGGVNVQQGVLAVTQDLSLGSATAMVQASAAGQVRFMESFSTSRTFDLTAGGAVSVDATKTITYNGAMISGGFLRGTGTHLLSNGTQLFGSTVLAGTNVTITNSTTLSNVMMGGNLTMGQIAATYNLSGGALLPSGTLSISTGTLNLSQWYSSGIITVPGSGLAPGRIEVTGSSVVLGGGSRTTIGANVAGQRKGTIFLNSQTLELNGGLIVNNADKLNATTGGIQGGTVNVNYGGTITGSGWFSSVVINFGGSDKTGNSIANTSRGNQTFNGGSSYFFEINRANGTAGGGGITPAVGWDLLNLEEFLRIGADSDNPVIIVLQSRNAADTGPGSLPDFNQMQPYQWLAFHVLEGGTVEGFAADKFTFDTSGFANLTNPTGIGTFAMSQVGNDVFVTYTPVPEPWGALVIAVCAFGCAAFIRQRIVVFSIAAM